MSDTASELTDGLHALRLQDDGFLTTLLGDVANKYQATQLGARGSDNSRTKDLGRKRLAWLAAEIERLREFRLPDARFARQENRQRIIRPCQQKLQALAQKLLLTKAEHTRERLVDQAYRSVHIAHDHGVGQALENGKKQRLLALQALFHVALRTQVDDRAGEESVLAQRKLADRQMHRKRRPVLAQTGNLAPDPDNLAPTRTEILAEIGVVLAAIWFRHQIADVAPADLYKRVAEQPFGGRVHRLDPAAAVDGDDGSDGGLEDRLEA